MKKLAILEMVLSGSKKISSHWESLFQIFLSSLMDKLRFQRQLTLLTILLRNLVVKTLTEKQQINGSYRTLFLHWVILLQMFISFHNWKMKNKRRKKPKKLLEKLSISLVYKAKRIGYLDISHKLMFMLILSLEVFQNWPQKHLNK